MIFVTFCYFHVFEFSSLFYINRTATGMKTFDLYFHTKKIDTNMKWFFEFHSSRKFHYIFYFYSFFHIFYVFFGFFVRLVFFYVINFVSHAVFLIPNKLNGLGLSPSVCFFEVNWIHYVTVGKDRHLLSLKYVQRNRKMPLKDWKHCFIRLSFCSIKIHHRQCWQEIKGKVFRF